MLQSSGTMGIERLHTLRFVYCCTISNETRNMLLFCKLTMSECHGGRFARDNLGNLQRCHHLPFGCTLLPIFGVLLVGSGSDGLQPKSDGLQPKSDGLQPKSDGLHLSSDDLHPSSDGLQPTVDGSACIF